MLRLDAARPVSFCDGLSRRDFLHAGAVATLGLTLPGALAQKAHGKGKDSDVNCIMLFLVGGPSHIDTFDPKPNAPAEVRGPFKPISTSVPGIQVCEHLLASLQAAVNKNDNRDSLLAQLGTVL